MDFFGLPITAKLIGNKSQTVGISVPRSQVFKAFQETPPFDSLIRTVGNTQLRILAPQKDSAFDPTYFDPYILQSWQQYQSQ